MAKKIAARSLLTTLVFLVLISSFGGTHPVQAQSSEGSIQVVPAFQEITLSETTQVATASIQLTNTSKIEQQFGITAVDIQQFDSNGQVILADKPLTNQNTALASFITIATDKITVPKESSVTVPLIISNAQSMSPGGHYAAVVARLIADSSSDQRVLPAVSSFLLVRKIGGEQLHLSLKKSPLFEVISTKLPQETALTFSNQGNTHIIPRGTINIKDFFGTVVAKATINENSLYIFPGTERSVSQKITYLKPIFLPMPLFITIIGSSQPGAIPYQQSGWFFYISPVSLLLFFALIGFGVFRVFIASRRKKS